MLTIAYWSKPGMPGGPVNADEVLQFFWSNEEGTQLTGFLELSGLVPSDNATAMLDASWNPLVDAVNMKNLTKYGSVLSSDSKITSYPQGNLPPQKFDKTSLLASLANDWKKSDNSKAIFPTKANAACANYVWGYSTHFDLQRASMPSSNSIQVAVSYLRLGAAGVIAEVGTWLKTAGGMPV